MLENFPKQMREKVTQIQKNNPPMKGKKEASERMLSEKEASQQSDTEFKPMVIRKRTELTENYQKLQGN